MKIFAMKPGHDGSLALLEDGVLHWQMEAEKNSFPRYEVITPDLFLRGCELLDDIPDVIAVSGWVKGWHSVEPDVNGGYFGYEHDHAQCRMVRFMGREVRLFTSTHERSHVFCSYGLSPFPKGQPCYALVWEGNLGCFYSVGPDMEIKRLGWPLVDPGNKYSQLFAIADPDFPSILGHFSFSNAGKLMALAGFAGRNPLDKDGERLIAELLAADGLVKNAEKDQFSWSRYHNIGVTHPDFKELAGHFSDRIFDIFYDFAKKHLDRGLPLLISGGCGLNCKWNTRWADSGLFEDVFVPPCTNDTGAAIGTAVEAQHFLKGDAKIHTWSVYSGEDFVHDVAVDLIHFDAQPADPDVIAEQLEAGRILAWVNGRYEMGPRALGNRSILAEPFSAETRDRLNEIKQREDYRPIAAICLENRANQWFDVDRPRPYMLYFHHVLDSRLKAVTHVDGSCRVQTVSPEQNPNITAIIEAFERRTGVAVLCNTSLNAKGRGFINCTTDLVQYCQSRNLDGFVVGGTLYIRSTDSVQNNKDMKTVRNSVSKDCRPHNITGRLAISSDTQASKAVTSTVVSQTLAAAEADPHQLVLTDDTGEWTFGQVATAATALACEISDTPSFRPGSRVGLLLPHDARVPVAMLGTALARGVFVPVDPSWPAERQAFVLRDADCVAVVHGTAQPPPDLGITSVLTDGLDKHKTALPGQLPNLQDAAYVLYTSGSTGQPKGVEVSHRAVSHLVNAVRPLLYGGICSGFREAIWAPFVFDVTIQQVFSGLVDGHYMAVVPDAMRRDPAAFLDLIVRRRIQLVNIVVSQLELLIEEDLGKAGGTLERIVTGGEQVPLELLRRLLNTPGLETVRVSNMYGPTENCVDSTCFEISTENVASLDRVPIGKPLSDVTAYVLGSDNVPVDAGSVGELCFSGMLLANGYLNQPELTRTSFTVGPDGTRMYRTGDLGRLRPDGLLEFLGRADDQVKVGGQRVQLAEIEHHLQVAPGVQQAAVVYRRRSIGGELVGVVTGVVDMSSVHMWLESRLPRHMVPARIEVCDGPLPTTHNGKIDRQNLLERITVNTGCTVGTVARTATERIVAHCWESVLDRRPGTKDRFVSQGADSLAAIRMVCQMRNKGLDVSFANLLKDPTLTELAAATRRIDVEPTHVPGNGTVGPATAAQRRLWYAHGVGDPVTYNVPVYRRIPEGFDIARFRIVLERLASHHAGLRTTFRVQGGQVLQQVSVLSAIQLDLFTAQSPAEARDLASAEAKRPLDLQKSPPWRVGLISAPDGMHLIWTLHHTLVDGWAITRLLDQANRLYRDLDVSLPPVGTTLIEHAAWESAQDLEPSLTHWKKQLQPWPARLPLPNTGETDGDIVSIKFEGKTVERLKQVARKHGVTMASLLMAYLTIVLSRALGLKDLCVGLGLANRARPGLDQVVGCFVNLLPIRVRFAQDDRIRDIVEQVNSHVADALEHQHCPLDEVVRATGRSGTPFEVAFAYQSFENLVAVDSPLPVSVGSELERFDYTLGQSRFAATLYTYRHFDELHLQLAFDRGRLSADIARSWLQAMETLARTAPDSLAFEPAFEFPRSILEGSVVELDLDQTVDRMFSARAAQTPDAVAIDDGTRTYSYAELDRASNSIAELLTRCLPEPGDVAVLAGRSFAQMAAMVGVLRAGHCYVPLNPMLPEPRLASVLDQTKAKLLLFDAAHHRLERFLAWSSPCVKMSVCVDLDDLTDLHEVVGPRMSETLWDHVARNATEPIAAGGWRDPVDGKVLSVEVMDDYSTNVGAKLGPWLNPETRVLEIGCGSGLTLTQVAPRVGSYLATDLSAEMVDWCRKTCSTRGWDHVICRHVAADAMTDHGPFDIVILNSVVQSFPSFDYLQRVLCKIVERCADEAVVFLGHLWDIEKRDAHCDPDALYVSRRGIDDLRWTVAGVSSIQVSDLHARTDNALTRTGFDALLTVRRGARMPSGSPRWPRLDLGDLVESAAPVHRADGDRPAYAIFTSGSTGAPKGVRITHRALANLCAWYVDFCEMTGQDTVLQVIATSFDASVKNAITPLTVGATVALLPEGSFDPDGMASLIEQSAVTILNPGTPGQFTPTVRAAAARQYAALKSLRVLALGGESPQPTQYRDWLTSGDCNLKWFCNVYGPTECADIAVAQRWEAMDIIDRQCLPIGRPLPNFACVVVDGAGQPVPIGEVGELVIGGIGVASGYIAHPKQTAARFGSDESGRRYRTGDQASVGADGRLWLHGRNDDEIKVRGQRVVLGEIERCCLAVDGVYEAVAVAHGDELRVAIAGSVATNDVRAELDRTLPETVVPSRILLLDKLPRNANGKVDRRAVAAIREIPRTNSSLNGTQGLVHRAWCEVLGPVTSDVDLLFTNAGGHSLALVELACVLESHTGRATPLALLAEALTIRQQATLLDQLSQIAATDSGCVLLGPPDAPAVFALPPISGLALYYRELGRRLAGVALHAFDFLPGIDPVECYAQAIGCLSDQPVVLCGASAGGNLAFSVAKRLETAGRSVARIVVVDSVPRATIGDVNDAIAWGQAALGSLWSVRAQRERVEAFATHHTSRVDDGRTRAPIEVVLSEDMFMDPTAAWADRTTDLATTHRAAGGHDDVISAHRLIANLPVFQKLLRP